MVARGGDRARQARKHVSALVADQRCLAVHELGSVRHRAAVGLGQRLVSEAYSQHGLVVLTAPADQVDAHSRIGRSSGPGGHEYAVTPPSQFDRFGERDVIIAHHRGLGAQLLQVADKRVDKAVVVVDDQDSNAAHVFWDPPIVESVRGLRKLNSENHGNT